jgi:hypothetical protein
MDDEQILLGLGYTLNEMGAILDRDGNYVESVDYNGRVIESNISRDNFDEYVNEQTKLKEIGFKYNVDAEGGKYFQQKVAIAKDKIKKYEQNPEEESLPANASEDPIYGKAFEDLNNEKEQGTPVYPAIDTMVEMSEEGTVLADIDDPDSKEMYKAINSRLAQIEELDPDRKTKSEEKIKQDLYTTGPNGLPIVNPGEDASFLEKLNYKSYKAINNVIDGIVAGVSPTGAGMESELLKKEYKQLKEAKKGILQPVASKRLEEVNGLMETLIAKREQTNFFSTENDKYAYAITKLEKQKSRLQDFIDNDSIDSNIFSINNIADWASLGIYDAYAAWNYLGGIRDKVDAGEQLDEADIAIAEATMLDNKINGDPFEQKYWHDITGGTSESLKFLGFGWGGRIASKAIGKTVANTITKTVGKGLTNRVINAGSRLATQSVLHPYSYKYAFEKYAGQFDMDESGNILAGQRLYDSQKHENILLMNEYDNEIAVAKAGGDTDTVSQLNKELKNLQAFDESLQKPMSKGGSLVYGLTEVFKENVAENYGSRLYRGIGLGRVEKAFNRTKLGKALTQNKLTKGFNKMKSAGKDFVNKNLGTIPGEKVIGSNTEEIFEELLVQATPSYGQTWEEYKEQAGQLLEGKFYSQVIGQTLLMQKTMQAGGVGAKNWNLYTKMDKADRAKRKATLDLYKELGNNKQLSQKDFNGIMMKAGLGDFSNQEFDNKIKELRANGQHLEANVFEQNKIYKQAIAAQQQGLLPQFKKALTKAKYNPNLTPETIANIQLLTNEVNEMTHDDETYINNGEVIGLKSQKRYAQKTLEELDAEKTNIDVPQAVEDFREVLEKNNFDTTIPLAEFESNPALKEYISNNFKKLPESVQKVLLINKSREMAAKSLKTIDKQIADKTSYEHQLNLTNEQDYLGYVDYVNRKAFNGNMTVDQFNTVIEKTPKNKTKYITKERINEINSVISNKLVSDELANKINNKIVKKQNDDTKAEESAPVETPEVTPESEAPSEFASQTQSVLNTAAVKLAQHEADKFDTENNVIINNSDDFEDLMIGDELADEYKAWSDLYEQQRGAKPTFGDFFNEALNELNGDKSAFDKESLEVLGQIWEDSGLGISNWEAIYNKHYTSISGIALGLTTKGLKTVLESTTAQQKEKTIKSQEIEVKKAQPVSGTDPITGEPIKLTPVRGKTIVVTGKANFNAIKYDQNKEIIEKDGKKVILYTKEDVVDSNDIPIFNDESFVNNKALLHPDRNNPGDKLTPNVTTEEDWGNETLVVFEQNPETFETISIPFPKWVRENKPKGMSDAEFAKTDEYIGKVPMYYTDSGGDRVAFVPDVDWYGPLSVKDTTKEAGEYVELDNLTQTHKNLIATGKKNALALRKAILDGRVKEVEIATKSGSPMLSLVKTNDNGDVLPTRPLSETAPDAKIVFLQGDTFIGLDGLPLKKSEIQILNEQTFTKKRKNAKGEEIIPYEPMFISPVNKTDGVQKYMAIPLNRLDENGNQKAMDEDIATAKYVTAAHETLYKNAASKGMTIDEAQTVRQQILDLTDGQVDIRNLGEVSQFVNGLVALQNGNDKFIAGTTGIPYSGGKGYFIDVLHEKDSRYTIVQNTSINSNKAHGIKITRPDGKIKVEKLTDTYEDFLRTRLSTSVLSYNMGTEENPAYTYSVQPIIELQPIGIELEQAQQEEVVQQETAIPTSDDQSLNDALNFLREHGGEIIEDEDYLVGSLDSVEGIEKALNVVKGLTIDEQHDVVNHLLALLSNTYKSSSLMTLKEFKDMTDTQFNKFFHNLLNDYKKNYETVSNFYNQDVEKNRKLEPSLRSFEKNIGKLETVIGNFDAFFKNAYLEGMRKGFIPSTVKTSDDLSNELKESFEDEMYQKDFNKSSNEIVHKDKVSAKLKRLFSTIPNGKKGFLGIPQYENYDTMYNTVATRIASPLPSNPSFKAMMERLGEIDNTHPWVKTLVAKLKESELDVQNSFVVNMYKYAANAKFIMIENLPDGVVSKLWFSNANDIKQKIKESWNNNFKRSTITNGNTINTEKLGKLYDQWESWGENKHEQSDEVLRKWLSDFGLEFSDGTWKELKDDKYVIGRGKAKTTLPFEKMFFDKGKRSNRLFSNLANYAKQYKNSKQNTLDFVNNTDYHPHEDMGTIIPQLVEMEGRHNTSLINLTRRDGDKTVSELVFPSFFFNNIRKLIHDADTEDKEYLNYLQGLDFSSDNHILDLLMNNDTFHSVFNYGETGLMSMKKRFGNNPKYSKIEQLSPIDYMFHQRAMFQYMKTKDLGDVKAHGFNMRLGTMSTPTNSDKGRMMLLQTAVFDLFSDTADAFNDDATFTPKLKEMLWATLVKPELKRIVNHTEDKNIEDYNQGAKRFNLMPILNVIEGKDGKKVLDYLKTNSDIDAFKDNFFDEISNYLEDSISREARENAEKTAPYTTGKVDEFNNRDYIKKAKRTKEQNSLIAELDYTINSMVTNMSSMQLIAGDPAMYYKSKVDTSKPLNINDQLKISKDLGVNMGKRLAMMIAPGNVLAESDGEQYLQLFLQDSEEVAQDVEEIISWHYGKKSLKEKFNDKTYQDIIDNLRLDEYKNDPENPELKALQNRFAKVKSFLQIESTDAQEYTTLKEHLRVLKGLGRLTIAQENDIINLVYGEQDISDKDMKSILDIVLQPLKPVYTGDIDSEGVRRIMYIKSSSFPLIPQLVRGSKLEALMDKMEAIEERTQMKVRASYQSANKVGAMSNPINPFDAESLAKLDEVDNEGNMTHALKLDRINFKIQQDIPFKEENLVSMGTQIFKLLFGDGIDGINGFKLEGVEMSGKELKAHFFDTFSEIIGIQKSKLLDNLGLNEDYTSDNPREAFIKVQQLLKKEAEERNFSENDIKSLDPSKTNDTYHFKQPLWFSGNANKFESMLNAIIGNKIFKQKLPGNSFVVGSEAGMQFKEGIKNVDGNNIVFIGDYRGGELKMDEVLAPSKFKLGDKYIDLFKKNKHGKYIYLKPEGNGFIINPEVISPELMENFAFRTPTSSHGSAATIKIVGFIPSVMGDLMITPKNFVAQMGQDFDIDKLQSYQYHYYDNDGKLERFNQDHKAYVLDQARNSKKIKDLDFINRLMQGLTATKDENAEFNNDPDLFEVGEELTEEQVLTRIERKLDLKLAQNKFIEIHHAVYNNPNADVQKKINKVLSMDFAENQADAIDALVEAEVTDLNILSPNYQMSKMIAGSTGSLAIGIYAKGVTFNSLAQQVDGDKITLQKKITVDGEVEYQNKTITIGKLTSHGTFGELESISIDGATNAEKALARSLAEVQDERVNTATDNEKAQILGRVGITHINTVAVDNLLSLLGFDAERTIITKSEYDSTNPFHKLTEDGTPYTEYSIPYLLHSQPIVKEYFERLKNARAIIQDYQENPEEAILEELLNGYESSDDNYSSNFTGEMLANAVKNDVIDTDFQKEVLKLYTSLVKDANELKKLQEVVDMSNLGKSMWELKDKIEKFTNLPLNTSFSNVEALLGRFDANSGELKIGNIYFTPTTNQGVMVGTALSLGRNLFFDYFPYYDPHINKTMESIFYSSSEDKNDVPSVDFQEDVFQEMKKYLTSATRNALFLDTPGNERTDLFFDTQEGHESLSTYVAKIKGTTNDEFKDGLKTIQNNAFLSYLNYTKGDAGRPSIIRFDNTETANVSEEHFYNSFKELFIKDLPLPNKNGKPYSTRLLAQELAAYSHLSGGIVREAIEFHRFIPIEYYDELKASNGNSVTRQLQGYDTMVTNWTDKQILRNFKQQFFQNNPEYTRQLSDTDRKDNKKTVFKGNLLEYNVPMKNYPEYLSFRNKNTKSKIKKDKWSLYKNIGNNKYEKIDVLGDFGMSEYDYNSKSLSTALPIVTAPVNNDPNLVSFDKLQGQVQNKPSGQSTGFSISPVDSTMDVLKKIQANNFKYNPNLSKMAGALIEMFGEQDINTPIKIINDPTVAYRGRFTDGTIIINVAKSDQIAQTFVHEFIHSVTSKHIKPYFDVNGNILEGAPKEVVSLNILFEEYKTQIIGKYSDEYKVYQEKMARLQNKQPVSFTNRETSLFYPTKNIREFLAVSLSNNKEFLDEASQIPYKKSGIKVLDKFAKIIDDILKAISGVKNNIAEQTLSQSLEVVKTFNPAPIKQEISAAELKSLQDEYIISQDNIFADDNTFGNPVAPDENFNPEAKTESVTEQSNREERLQKSLDSIKIGELNSFDMYPITATLFKSDGTVETITDTRDVSKEDGAWRIKQTIQDFYAREVNPFGNAVIDDIDLDKLPDCIN